MRLREETACSGGFCDAEPTSGAADDGGPSHHRWEGRLERGALVREEDDPGLSSEQGASDGTIRALPGALVHLRDGSRRRAHLRGGGGPSLGQYLRAVSSQWPA